MLAKALPLALVQAALPARSMMCSVAAGEIEITKIKIEYSGEWWNAGVLG